MNLLWLSIESFSVFSSLLSSFLLSSLMMMANSGHLTVVGSSGSTIEIYSPVRESFERRIEMNRNREMNSRFNLNLNFNLLPDVIPHTNTSLCIEMAGC